jgi:hypothetical protein
MPVELKQDLPLLRRHHKAHDAAGQGKEAGGANDQKRSGAHNYLPFSFIDRIDIKVKAFC